MNRSAFEVSDSAWIGPPIHSGGFRRLPDKGMGEAVSIVDLDFSAWNSSSSGLIQGDRQLYLSGTLSLLNNRIERQSISRLVQGFEGATIRGMNFRIGG